MNPTTLPPVSSSISWLTFTSIAFASFCVDRAAHAPSPAHPRGSARRVREAVREHHEEAVVPSAVFGFVRPRSVVRASDWTTVCEIAAASSPSGRQLSATSHVRLRCVNRVIRSPVWIVSGRRPRHSRSEYVRVPASEAHRLTALSSPGPRASRPSNCTRQGYTGRTEARYWPCSSYAAHSQAVSTCEVPDAGVGCLGGAGPVLCAVNRHVLRFRGGVFWGPLGRCSARSAPLAGV